MYKVCNIIRIWERERMKTCTWCEQDMELKEAEYQTRYYECDNCGKVDRAWTASG